MDDPEADSDVEAILDEARESLSSFCVEECHAYCCRKGYLVLKPSQLDVTMQGREEEYVERSLLKRMSDGNWSLFMGEPGLPCPSLSENKCLIHKDPSRSDTCRVFPISVDADRVVRVSLRCPAGKNQMLYPYVARLVKCGCRVEE